MTRNRMRPIHPGEILREEFLVPVGMTAHALSQAIRVPATRVNDIVNGKRGVTADPALRLARYFGNSPEFWLNLQAVHDLLVPIRPRGSWGKILPQPVAQPSWIDAESTRPLYHSRCAGMAGHDFAALGIPTEREYVDLCCARTGRDRIERNEWEFCVVFSMFRLAAILQGIAKRALTGTAADAKATEVGARARSVADVAWRQVVALESGS